MNFPRSRRCYRRFLCVSLLAAICLGAVLRFVGLGFGRGVLCPRPDEELVRSAVLISLTGDLNPHYAVWGHLYHYIYSAVVAVWTVARLWSGQAASWTDAVAATHCEPDSLIWLGRAISATSGVLTIFATYRLARRSLVSRLGALCSCLMLSTLFLHVRDSHFATSDCLLALFCTAGLAAMAGGTQRHAASAGLWTGLALATKLLSVTIVLTFFTLLILKPLSVGERIWGRCLAALRFLTAATVVALVVQPFLLLDPMETWYGLFGDLFNPERRPFEHGLNLTNAAILARYYVPQALGWPVGIMSGLAGLILLKRFRSTRIGPLLAYTFWSLAALFSVQRIFLRYLDPLLPVICVLSAHGIEWLVRRFSRRSAQIRLISTLTLALVLSLPNLIRDVWLDLLLLKPDTRALAADWLERNVPPGSRILWSGYGSIAPHLTMPWLYSLDSHDREHIALRTDRGLPVDVDEAIIRWKATNNVATYSLVGFAIGTDKPEQSGLDAYPMLDHRYEIPVIQRLDEWSRRRGLLHRESPRWEWMRRHVIGLVELSPESLADRTEEFVVITGMPCDPAAIGMLRQSYDEVRVFDPGVSWSEFGGSVMYDLGDAWYAPNWGIERVHRAGPEVRVFQKR